RQALEERPHDREQLEDDRRADIRHDAEREDCHLRQVLSREHVVEPEHRVLRLIGEQRQRIVIHAGRRDVAADAVRCERAERAETLTTPHRTARPCSRSRSGVTSMPASNRAAIVSRFTTSYSTRKGLWKPRFGTRRCSGIWPPSNPRLCLKPERDFAPLCPRPAVLPLPEPWPRPTRFFACFAPFGGRRFERSMILVPVIW